MKVALINPGKKKSLAIHEPLNLGYLASYLEARNFKVKIFDQFVDDNIKNRLSEFNPDFVGITGTTPVIKDAYELAKITKKMGIPTCMGGVHVSVMEEEALNYCDIVGKGEGEKALIKILTENIKDGIVEGEIITNLDEIPPPARHLINMEFYVKTKDRLGFCHLHFVPPNTRVASLLTSRGCPYACIFCHNSWRRTPLRLNSKERVIYEIEKLITDYNIQALFFMDDDFLSKKERVIEICNEMIRKKYNLIFGLQARVNAVDKEILKLLREAGCSQITFGFETGSQRILDILKNKTTTIQQNKQAIELCREVGLPVAGTFMIGNPTETVEDIKLTWEFIKNNPLDGIGIHITTPYPGTKLWKWCVEKNLIPNKIDYSQLDTASIPFCASDTLSKKEIDK